MGPWLARIGQLLWQAIRRANIPIIIGVTWSRRSRS